MASKLIKQDAIKPKYFRKHVKGFGKTAAACYEVDLIKEICVTNSAVYR